VHTVSAWIKTLRTPTLPLPIMSWGELSSGQQWLLQVDADKRFRVSSAAGIMSANDQIIGDGKWHHIAVVLHPVDSRLPLMSDVMLYVDGTRRGIYKMQESRVQLGSMENIRVGMSHDGDGPTFQGTMDEVKVYDSVISNSHLRTLSRQQEIGL
jgi:hypothetical protein